MKIRGNRTYMTIGMGIVTVIGVFINSGDFSIPSFIELSQAILPWVAGIFGRKAIK